MLQRLMAAGIVSGIIVGALVTLLHLAMVAPLILEAETFEGRAATVSVPHDHGPASAAHSHGEDAWSPEDGWERSLYTLAANLVMAVGFALLLAAAYTLRGESVDVRTGAFWGLAGFLAFSFLPALGLPPELPGSAAGDLAARQIWWGGTVFASIGGLALVTFGRPLAKGAGLILLLLPHFIGAPHPPAGEAGMVPPELAAHFVVATMFVNAAMWIALGIVTAYFFIRFAGATRGRVLDIQA